jgi:hypothetical protein
MKKRLAKKLVKRIEGARLHEGFNAGFGRWWGVELDVDGEAKIFTVDEYNTVGPCDTMICEVGMSQDSKGRYDVLYCQNDPELIAETIKLMTRRKPRIQVG